jgi:hypothetical protein
LGAGIPRIRGIAMSSDTDPLIGNWSVSGGSWEISGGPDEYSVVEMGAIGQTGSGIARLAGDQVAIQLDNGTTYQLTLDGANNTLSGYIFGVVPVVAHRDGGGGGGVGGTGQCGSCFGSGKRTCPTCRGSGMYQRPSMSSPMICTLCSGGKVRCDFCSGTGKIRAL